MAPAFLGEDDPVERCRVGTRRAIAIGHLAGNIPAFPATR